VTATSVVGTGRRLVVAEEGADGTRDANLQASVRLFFRFDEDLDAPCVPSATGPNSCNGTLSCVVPSLWRPIQADFRQQVLNLPFADLLTRCRPHEVRVESLRGCSLDLPRVAELLGVPATVVLPHADQLPESTSRAAGWLRDALRSAAALESPSGIADVSAYAPFTGRPIHPYGQAPLLHPPGPATAGADGLGYALYEFVLRDHPMLWRMQQGYVHFFEACGKVLDLGCGAGVFLGLLEEAGIPARGVERSAGIVRYAQGLGFEVAESDAIEYLEQHAETFDGIYCSHFVEHLDTEGVERLVRLLARALVPGGRAVLVFPDPESIRSQLLGFWRDPEHVRFYHPDLIELMGRAQGLDCVWHSHRDGAPHTVVPFPPTPASFRQSDAFDAPLGEVRAQPTGGLGTAEGGPPRAIASRAWRRLLERLRLAPLARVQQLEQDLARQGRLLERLADAVQRSREDLHRVRADTHVLWQVNQTWAWEDNAVLVLEKPRSGTAR